MNNFFKGPFQTVNVYTSFLLCGLLASGLENLVIKYLGTSVFFISIFLLFYKFFSSDPNKKANHNEKSHFFPSILTIFAYILIISPLYLLSSYHNSENTDYPLYMVIMLIVPGMFLYGGGL